MPAFARAQDELCHIGGAGCPYTLPVAGSPLIAHAVKALCDAGVSEVLVATDAQLADEIGLALAGDRGVPVHVALLPPDDAEALRSTIAKVLGEGPLLVHEGDALLADGFSPDGEDVRAQGAAQFVAGDRALAYSLSTLPPDGIQPSGRAVEIEGWRYDGTVDGLLEANTMALDRLKRGRVGADLADAAVQGRVHIDPSAELKGAKIRGPVHIGPGACLVETYVGPYTTIGADVTLEGVELENSIVLPGADIRYPGRRIEASLVGEGAHIGRDYTLPSALRLRVGPGADIQLS